jgi:DnaJ family protein A protein 2
MAQQGPMIYQFEQVCPDCHGTGHHIDDADLCPECKGKKVTIEDKEFTIEIQKGMDYDEQISFFKEGDQVPGQTTGNLIFVLRPDEHDRTSFKRSSDDLILMDYEIPLIGALTGYQFKLKHLDGRDVYLQTKGIIRPGDVMKVSDLGMPIKNQLDSYGNLILKFIITFPTELSPEEEHRLLEVFPKTTVEAPPGSEIHEVENAHDAGEDMPETSEEEQPQDNCSIQ